MVARTLALGLLVVSSAGAAAPTDVKVSPELLKARLEAAREAYKTAETLYQQGRTEPEMVYRWSARWLSAQQAAAGTKAERVRAAEAHLLRMQELEKGVKGMTRAGVRPPFDGREARFYVAEAEVWLAQARAE
jgi:outer membrane protein TolC